MRYVNKFNRYRGKSGDRRGVLLLVVLSLLVLFALITMTFVMVARQYRSNSRGESKNEQRVDDPRKQLDSAALIVARGSLSKLSPVPEGLFGDMYGYESVKSQVANPAFVSNGQFIQFEAPNFDATLPTLWYPATSAARSTGGYFNGCVLTFLTGALAGESTRIVGYRNEVTTPSAVPAAFQVLAIEGKNVLPKVGDQFLINGRPFNGAGQGFNPTSGKMDAKDSSALNPPYALLLNSSAYDTSTYPAGGWSPDEDYDAPDAQNALLAYLPDLSVLPAPDRTPDKIVPSLHRPDLISYWMKATSKTNWYELDPDLLRKVMIRPSPLIHFFDANNNNVYDVGESDFTGKAYDATTKLGGPIFGPWDVDNDGDGFAESIWADLGQPVTTTPDGRMVKPLFAVLCLDLDGRLNVNAHGNLAHVERWIAESGAVVASNIAGGAATRELIPGGEGYGAAEVNLRHSNFFAAAADYERLLIGDTSGPSKVEGRYGELGLTWRGGYTSPYPGDTVTGNPRTGTLAELQFSQFPPYSSPPPSPAILTAFGSLPNLWGRRPIALDWRGVPFFRLPTDVEQMWTETQNNPYEINLSRKAVRASRNSGGTDAPFTAAELERVLRPFDVDQSSLPSRLQTLVGLSNVGSARALVTTDSWDPPVPSLLVREGSGASAKVKPYGSIAELYWDRLDATVPLPPTPPGTPNKATELVKMLPPELMSGLRLDINHPFGNGRDDDGNGVVDEPQEAANLGTPEPAFAAGPASFGGVGFWHTGGLDLDGDNTIDGDSNAIDVEDAYYSRHLMARYLYCLAMFLRATDVASDHLKFNASGVQSSDETAESVAQWAVNIVDFRDRDSIMTGFEYDKNPFNGWTVDGDLSTTADADRAVVWGCERPELLITETLAFHDRRTEDRDDEDPVPATDEKGKTTDPPPKTDTDFDQRLQPRGRFFLELYNPWPSVEAPPGELHAMSPVGPGVALNRTAPGGQPVWRVLIAKGDTSLKDTDATVATERLTNADIERSIFFVKPPATQGAGTEYFVDPADADANKIAPILPGRYAVIGSGIKQGTDYVTTIGRTTTANEATIASLTSGRRIVMSPDVHPDQSDVVVRNNANATNPNDPDVSSIPANPAGKKPSVAIVVNGPRPLSVSEPKSGYPATTDPAGAGGEGQYAPPRDIPLDADAGISDDVALATNGVKKGYKTVYLQRLANPLLKWNPEAPNPQHDATAPLNPYLTIDSSLVDVTAFNGIEDDSSKAGASTDGMPSLQRGEDNDVAGVYSLWRREELRATLPPAGAADLTQIFRPRLVHSIGYLNQPTNKPFGDAWTTVDATGMSPSPDSTYIGDPKIPFAWMTWNNRPFANELELLQVPRLPAWRLTREYTPPNGNPYSSSVAQTNVGEYGHLFNVFNSDDGTNFSRVLDFLRVPSRFVGSNTWLNPTSANGFGKVQPNEGAFWQVTHPPFNRISNYRDPGLVNINTISDRRVWLSLMDGRITPDFNLLMASRRGAAGVVPYQTMDDPANPFFFGRPFRGPAGAELTNSMMVAAGISDPPLKDVDVTLLRPQPGGGKPLFAEQGVRNIYDDADRNPYFRYETLQRLSSMVTTRSNVYAVWITVGYFEVDANGKLRQEVGADTGEIARHRAFYIFDRTIPVGYERGVDHNVEKAILLRRFIE